MRRITPDSAAPCGRRGTRAARPDEGFTTASRNGRGWCRSRSIAPSAAHDSRNVRPQNLARRARRRAPRHARFPRVAIRRTRRPRNARSRQNRRCRGRAGLATPFGLSEAPVAQQMPKRALGVARLPAHGAGARFGEGRLVPSVKPATTPHPALRATFSHKGEKGFGGLHRVMHLARSRSKRRAVPLSPCGRGVRGEGWRIESSITAHSAANEGRTNSRMSVAAS
jgi:hypothetical protein